MKCLIKSRWMSALVFSVFLLGVMMMAHVEVFASEQIKPKRTFTVRDSIEMTRIIRIDGGISVGSTAEGIALFSPDKQHFLVRTRRGDLVRDVNIDELLLWNTKDINTSLALKDKGVAPAPKILAKVSFHDDWAEVSHIQWLSNQEVGIIAQGDNHCMQAFIVDIGTGAISQITHAATDVASFSVSGDCVVYFARTKRPTVTLISGAESISKGLSTNDPRSNPVELFQASRSTGKTDRIEAPAIVIQFSDEIWISPTGDYAITLTPAVNAPAHWADYRVADSEHYGWTTDRIITDPTTFMSVGRLRYQLIDLKTCVARPLFDAPNGALAFNGTPKQVFWLHDRHSVVVSNTYLPLEVADQEEKARRTQGPAIAEVDLCSGKALPIFWEPLVTIEERKTGKKLEPIVSIDWDEASQTLTVGQLIAGSVQYVSFTKSGETWRRIDKPKKTIVQKPVIERQEDMNKRPKLYASGGACSCTKKIFDPWPQGDQFSFGRAEVYTWADSNNLNWTGVLIYPLNHKPGNRYPLVVQTHGFSEKEFLADGPAGATTAFSAQALANSGFMVLQAIEPRQAMQGERQGKMVAEGWRAGIEKLVADGLVDPANVGLIAFFETGYHAISLLAEQPNLLKAIDISDSVQYGYIQYSMFYSTNEDFRHKIEMMTGGTPETVGYGKWFDQNPLYRISKSAAAVRIEAGSSSSLVSMWETYALLRAAGRPVDLVYFPENAAIVLMKPSERLGSQGGNVDWFRFWLQDYEDPDPAKTKQYARWRKLRQPETVH